jgi:hypothetical protein
VSRENWFLQVVRNGFEPTNEANTSRFVHEALRECFGWPYDRIQPQASKRGFIDYRLALPRTENEILIEVKPFRASLRDEMITKYLVTRGPSAHDVRVGVLTNLAEWQVFVAGPEVREVAGKPFVEVHTVFIEGRKDIADLEKLIGFRSSGDLAGVRGALGESWDVLGKILCSNDEVHAEVRRQLRDLRDRHGLNVAVPGTKVTTEYVRRLMNGKSIDDFPFSPAKLRQAVCAREVAEAANNVIRSRFGSRTRVAAIQQQIRNVALVGDMIRKGEP